MAFMDPSGTWLPWTLIAAAIGFVWKAASDYQKLKDLAERQKEMPTKLDVANMQAAILKILHEEFVTKREFEQRKK